MHATSVGSEASAAVGVSGRSEMAVVSVQRIARERPDVAPPLYAGRPCGPIIAVPTGAGAPQAPGLRLGPAYILAQFDPQDYVLHRPRLGNASVTAVTAAVGLAVSRSVARGMVPVVIGGDHTVALGSVLGVKAGLGKRARQGPHLAGRSGEPLFLLWLDAHPDLNTGETSPTGNLHGMVLAGLLGSGPLAVEEPLTPERVTLAGVRAFDAGERSLLDAQPALSLWDVESLRGDGWLPRLDALLERVRRAGGRLYVSLDMDVFDPYVAPGVAVPVAYGALAEPVMALLRRVGASGLLAGADVVELFPPADRERQTARLAARAVAALGAAVMWSDGYEGGDAPTTRRCGAA